MSADTWCHLCAVLCLVLGKPQLSLQELHLESGAEFMSTEVLAGTLNVQKLPRHLEPVYHPQAIASQTPPSGVLKI